MQRCIWERPKKVSGVYHLGDMDEEDIVELPRIRISPDIMSKIRILSNAQPPTLRPSIQRLIEPEKLEEAILSVVLKHFDMKDMVDNLSLHEADMSNEYFTFVEIIQESYLKFNRLVRILQQIAEIENTWNDEVTELRAGLLDLNECFFANYCHDESKIRSLTLLSFVKDVEFDPKIPQKSVDDLNKLMEIEANTYSEEFFLQKTQVIIKALQQRIDLLLKVNIQNSFELIHSPIRMSRSLERWPRKKIKSFTDKNKDQILDDSILIIPKLQLKRKVRKMNGLTYEKIENHKSNKMPNMELLQQLFEFIGSSPEKAVTSNEFIEAAKTRKSRGLCRRQALTIMKKILQLSYSNGSGAYNLNAITSILQYGPKLEELTCGGMKNQVLELYSDLLSCIVNLSSFNSHICRTSLCLLCIVPYSRAEESCLVKSGLVNLLDNLCGLERGCSNPSQSNDTLSQNQELSLLAWAGFKVLASRCMQWQEAPKDEDGETEFHHLILPQQVSVLLTNNLNRTKNKSIETSNYEGLQEILILLNNLAESKMGKNILSQPTCISKLLYLLLEPKLSPKMIQTILQLCHVALPLLSPESVGQVDVPSWSLGSENMTVSEDNPYKKMIKLLLAKVADYLVPGYQVYQRAQKVNEDEEEEEQFTITDIEMHTVVPNDIPDMDRTMSLYLYKREDETAQEIIQHLLNVSSEMRLFRMTETQNMEKVVKMDTELNRMNKTEVLTDEATVILRRAIKLAQQGFVVSVGPPIRKEELTEEKKNAVEQIAKERNVVLSKHDPPRPFVSSSVSNSLASDLISLIHTLFSSSSAEVWTEAIYEVATLTIRDLRRVSESIDLLNKDTTEEMFDIFTTARDLLAVIALLGGHQETLRQGLIVSLTGDDGSEDCGEAEILSISESTGLAMVKLLIPNDTFQFSRPSNCLPIPLGRLRIKTKCDPVHLFEPIEAALVSSLQSVLLPDPSGTDPLSVPLPSKGDGRSLKLATARLVAEVRTKSTALLALYLHDAKFACRFLQNSCQAVDMLKCLSNDCLPSDRQDKVVSSTEKLRNLYRDCVKPPAPPSRKPNNKNKLMIWDPSKTFPPLKSVLFSHNMHGITYYEDPGNNAGQPRGVFVYANQKIPSNALNFYWELDVISLGDSPEDNGSILSVGFSPLSEKRDGSWSNPVGTMLFHNNGRVVHYNGQSLLQWRSLRFDVHLNPGDNLGIGWEKLFEAQSNNPASGRVYFTINGNKLDQALEYVNGDMYPVVHIQKKNVRVKANFGNSKFAYADGVSIQARVNDMAGTSRGDTDEDLRAMPFQGSESMTSSGTASPESVFDTGAGHRRLISLSSRSALTPKPLKEYCPSHIEDIRSELCHEPTANTGSHVQSITLLDEDSDSEDETETEDDGHLQKQDDINSLLVKSWETKVFPIISRRFRNEAERRDGLEQIKGALSLGMADIARQTVEFLYEENGGIPRDLHLPTIENVKTQLTKLSIDRIRKSQPVFISNNSNLDLTNLPKFCVPLMLKTLGLPGEVLEIDVTNELVQVETYLRLEGMLVRFWYPLSVLEKVQDTGKRTAVTGTQIINISNDLVHRELLSWEFASTRIFCREAYINLIQQSRNKELPTYITVNENSSMSTMFNSSIMMFQDIDMENLQCISNCKLANPCNENMLERNLNITSSENILKLQKGKVSDLFFRDGDLLKKHIHDFIRKARAKGQDFLIELSNQICDILEHAPEMFSTEEVSISDISTLKSTILFPKAAFVAATVKLKRDIGEITDMKDLTIQIQTIDGTNVRQSGKFSSKDIIQYPKDVAGHKQPVNSAFLPVMMASDIVRVSHSGGEDMGFKLYLQSLPPEFPLALTFIEEIAVLAASLNGFIDEVNVQNLICMVCRHLTHMEIIQPIKERMLLLLAELIRNTSTAEKMEVNYSVLTKMKEEMKMLYDLEVTRKDFLKFSSYFQSLFEVSAALLEVHDTAKFSTLSRSPTPASEKESSPGICPKHLKRRMRVGNRGSDVSLSRTLDKTHITEKSWLPKAIIQVHLTKYLVTRNTTKKIEKTKEFIKNVYTSQLGPNDYSRLIVMQGLPRHLMPNQLIANIQKAMNNYGGLFKNEVYMIPVKDIENMKPSLPDTEQIGLEDIEFDSDQELPDIDIDELSERQDSVNLIETVMPNNSGLAVIQIRGKVNFNKCKEELETNTSLNIRGEFDTDGSVLSVCGVLQTFQTEDPMMMKILDSFLCSRIYKDDCKVLNQDCYNALEDIFLSCYMANQRDLVSENIENEDFIALQFPHILKQVEDNMMYSFLYGIKQSKSGLIEGVKEILQQYGLPCRAAREYVPSTPMRKKRNSAEASKMSTEQKDFNPMVLLLKFAYFRTYYLHCRIQFQKQQWD